MAEEGFRIFSCLFEVTIFGGFFRNILENKYQNRKINILLYGSLFLGVYTVNLFNITLLNLVGNVLLYFVFLFFIYESGIKEKIFYYLLFYTVFAGAEFIVEILLMLTCGEKYNWAEQNLLFRVLIYSLEKLITFLILYSIQRKINNHEKRLNNKMFYYSLMLPIATFLIFGVILYDGIISKLSITDENILALGCILLLFANAGIFIVYDSLFSLIYEKQKYQILALKSNMEKQYYDRLEAISWEQQSYMHDAKKYMRIIGNLAMQEQNEEICNIIQDMKIRIDRIESKCFCTHKILNTILCEKEKESAIYNIDFDAYVEPGIKLDRISDIDIIVIMGNLLDNAIEAAKTAQNSFIDVQVFENQRGHFLIFKIENNFEHVIKKDKGKFLTTKDNTENHGLGLNNVEKCIDSLGGLLTIDVNANIFLVTVILNIS